MPSSLLDSFKSANTELNAESFIEAMPPEVGTCEAATAPATGGAPGLRLAVGGLEAVVAAGATSRVCCRLTGDRVCGGLVVGVLLLAPWFCAVDKSTSNRRSLGAVSNKFCYTGKSSFT